MNITVESRPPVRDSRREGLRTLRPILKAAGASVGLCLSLFGFPSAAKAKDSYPVGIFNLYGETGLLDMPTAEFNPDGEIAAGASFTPTMDRYSLDFTALPWLEATFRYSRIDRWNNLFGTGGDLYDRSLGFKVRLSQEEEYWPAIAVGAQDILGTGAFGAEYLVASKHIGDFDVTAGLGWRRFGDGPITFPNPLGYIFPSFKARTGFEGTGVPLLNQFFHGPNVGVIGGVSWQTPIEGLQLIAELSGDDFTRETKVGSISVKSPFNFGFSYEPFSGIQIGGGYLYGTQFGVRVTFFANPFDRPYTTRLGTQPLPVNVRTPEARNTAELAMLQSYNNFYDNWPDKGSTAPRSLADMIWSKSDTNRLAVEDAEIYGDSLILKTGLSPQKIACSQLAPLFPQAQSSKISQIAVLGSNNSVDVKICPVFPSTPRIQHVAYQAASGTVEDEAPSVTAPKSLKEKLSQDMSDQGLILDSILIQDQEIDIAYTNTRYRTETEAIGRLVRILMADAPDMVSSFHLISVAASMPQREVDLNRADIERIYQLSGDASELFPSVKILAPAENNPAMEKGSLLDFPNFDWGIAPGYRQSLFDPDQPYRFGFYGTVSATESISRNLSFSGAFEFNIYNTFDITRQSNSVLPHVRSDFAQYLKHGENGIASLSAQYITKLSPDVYFLGRAGYLENMFAGVGGEIYWQPPHQRISFGAALYAVQQRDFNELLGFQHYRVLTGHLSMYYQSPYHGMNFELHVGRYLAGDYGATFEVTRRFDSGVEIGAFATLTNVPFSKFGEGSFDKGFIIHIPVDFLAPLNTQSEFTMDFTPLTRDGGQRLDGEQTLFYATRRASEGELLSNWSEVLEP